MSLLVGTERKSTRIHVFDSALPFKWGRFLRASRSVTWSPRISSESDLRFSSPFAAPSLLLSVLHIEYRGPPSPLPSVQLRVPDVRPPHALPVRHQHERAPPRSRRSMRPDGRPPFHVLVERPRVVPRVQRGPPR